MVKDGTRPDTAAGNSFCSDLFVTPMLTDNVIVTTGDMGGRMNNKLREGEMFVIIPAKWADNLIGIIGDTPDVKGIYEATRPEDSAYWDRQKAKSERAAADPGLKQAKTQYGLEISMPWDDDALAAVAKAPKFVRKMAVANVEDFAEEKDFERVTLQVVQDQADSVGMGKFMRNIKDGKGSLLKRLFGRD